jgi:hypothetical protein
MSSKTDKQVYVLVVAFCVVTPLLVFFATKQEERLRTECEASGGVFISGRGMQCIPLEKFQRPTDSATEDNKG